MQSFDYQRFFEISLDMLCIASTDGYFLKVNASFCEALGYLNEELIGHRVFEFIHADDIEKTQNELTNLACGTKVLNFENRYKHKSGHYLTLVWRAQLDTNSNAILASAQNITEELILNNRLSQIEKALNHSTIMAETDCKGRIINVNDKFCKISGYTKEELLGKTHAIVNSGHHDRAFFTQMWKTIKSNKVWSGLIKNKKKSGEYYFVQTIITPITDHQGCIKSYLAIRQDITQSIEFESEISRILKILNATSSIAKIGGWELDVRTGELTWTDETFKILEFSKKAGQKPILPEGLELFTSEYKPVIERAVARAIEFGEPYDLEVKALTAKGNERWVHTTGHANVHEGKVVSLSGTIQDIDEKKKIEYKYKLEKQNSIQQSKLASLGELAASMAHEINNPLGIISGNTELLLLTEELSQKGRNKLDVIFESCERITHMVKNLKRFSRKENDTTKKHCDLAQIINNSVAMAMPRLKREQVVLRFYKLEECIIECLEFEIEQVFLNLINNAIDAISRLEQRFIEISMYVQDEFILCRVLDAGCGINKSERDKIFEPFYTSKPVDVGTGLGLSIVKNILSEHNAKIEYDASCTNTCFVLKFPKCP
ncbi:hypothetical protein PA25_35270 [Pseudoalteromonas sp. A25]|uniref:PAS domain-containing sensor histidine kinase n=1 Tax=Pseudoalteromonas sp. A25 TaxID=116092 RepID=UPI00129F0F12|nr:PAS domain-containing sensor histidine kinase [Pseudoalteromonas sp. A25]BBN83542.1 hypothetical protein PA25_35270 [Pseudoalteromonas sp. A25]